MQGKRGPAIKETVCLPTNILAISNDGEGNAANITDSLMAFK